MDFKGFSDSIRSLASLINFARMIIREFLSDNSVGKEIVVHAETFIFISGETLEPMDFYGIFQIRLSPCLDVNFVRIILGEFY